MKSLREILDDHPSLTIDGYNSDMKAKDYAFKREALTHNSGLTAASMFLFTHRIDDDEYVDSETLRQYIEDDPIVKDKYGDVPITIGAVILAALCKGYEIESGPVKNANVWIF
jgi:hypothetical protein